MVGGYCYYATSSEKSYRDIKLNFYYLFPGYLQCRDVSVHQEMLLDICDLRAESNYFFRTKMTYIAFYNSNT